MSFADEHAPEVDASAGAPGTARAAGASGVDLDEEVVDGLPVIAEVRTIDRPSAASLPAVQAAAAAATGFVCGAATIALIKRRSARKVVRNGKGGARRAADLLPIVGSRSFLVDVHVIGKQGD